MGHGSRRYAAFLAIGVGVAAAATEDPTSVFSRIRPTQIVWGEVALRAGAPIDLPIPDPMRFGRTLGLSFTRLERKDPAGNSESTTRSTEVGSIHVAFAFTDERTDWRAFRDRLDPVLARVASGGFAQFIAEFPGFLKESPLNSDFDAIVCAESVERRKREVTRIERSTSEDGRVGVFSDSRSSDVSLDESVCDRLETSLRDLPPVTTRVTEFEIERAVEELLTLSSQERLRGEVTPLPDGASLERLPAEPGVLISTSTTAAATTGRATAEFVRTPRIEGDGGNAGTERIRTTVIPATFAKDALDQQGWLLRWTSISEIREFGVRSRVESTITDHSDVAILLTRSDEVVELSAVVDAVALAIAARPRTDWHSLIAETLAAADLGTPDAVLIRCGNPDDSPRHGDYCLGPACAELLDPGPFCDGLARRLQRW